MSPLDWFIAGIISLGVAIGCIKGAIRQLASIVGLLTGLLVARALFVVVGDRLGEELGTSVTFARILAFILIGVLVPVVFLFLSSALTRIVNGLQLGWVNRLLGAGLGAVKYMLLVSIAIHCLEFIDSEDSLITSTNKQQSLLYIPVKDSASYFYPVIKDVTKKLIN